MSDIEALLRELLENQRKLLKDTEEEKARIKKIEERLEKIEFTTTDASLKINMPPALVRVLKALVETNKPANTEQIAESVSISRNLASSYLNRLVDMGYVIKEPNLTSSAGPRYLFKTDLSLLPPEIRRVVERYKLADDRETGEGDVDDGKDERSDR